MKSKNIIITGTSRGIGYELALQFVNAGHQVLAISRKTPKELIKLLDNVKVSDLPVDEKGKLIEEIEYRLNGRRYTDKQVLKDIEESQADISDIN